MWTNYQNKEEPYTNNSRTDCFMYPFLPFTLNDWFNLDLSIRNSESISIFKSRLLSFIRPVQSNIYCIFHLEGLKFRLPLDLSHLNEHRFRLNFQDCMNPAYVLVVWISKIHHITELSTIFLPSQWYYE